MNQRKKKNQHEGEDSKKDKTKTITNSLEETIFGYPVIFTKKLDEVVL